MKSKELFRETLLFVFFWAFVFMVGMMLVNHAFRQHIRQTDLNTPYIRAVALRTSSSSLGRRSFPQVLPGFKTYRSKKFDLEFNYPEILKVKEKDGVIAIEHSVSFKHLDPCGGGGSPQYQYVKKIFDFYAKVSILNKTPTETFREELMEVNTNDLVVGIKNSVRVTYGELDGFRLYNSSPGCGFYSYFFQIADEKVLRVDRWPASEFKEILESEKQMFSRLRQIILPEKEEHFFREILTSLKVNEKGEN